MSGNKNIDKKPFKLRLYQLLNKFGHALLKRCPFAALKSLILDFVNLLLVRIDYQRALCGLDEGLSWNEEFILKKDDSVKCYGLWVVELFTPSMASDFANILERRGWDRNDRRYGNYRGNSSVLQDVRAFGRSGSWWLLGTIVAEDLDTILLNRSVRGRLPEPFSRVRMSAFQYGSGTTMVVAFCELRKAASSLIEDELRKSHEPRLIKRKGRRALFLPRRESCRDAVRQERINLHQAARRVLSEQCPGFFSKHGMIHPTLDLILFGTTNPCVLGNEETFDLFNHLGVEDASWMKWLPSKISCVDISESPRREGGLPSCWSILGNERSVLSFFEEDLKHCGNEDAYSLGYVLDDWVGKLISMIAMVEYCEAMAGIYGQRRDEAVKTHGRFRSRELEELREVLLSESIDIATMNEDSEAPWDERARIELGDIPCWICKGQHSEEEKSLELLSTLKDRKDKAKKQLLDIESTYITALSSVSELGAARASLRWSRVATVLAFASLIIALITLLATAYSEESILFKLLSYV